MHTAMPTASPECNSPQTLGSHTERPFIRIILLLVLLVCSCVSEARAGCSHAQPAGWYSQLRSDLPETMKAADNTRWNGLFEVVYEDGQFVYVAGASDSQSHLPRCGRDAEETLRQLALHFGASRPSLLHAMQFLEPVPFQRPSSCHPGEMSFGLRLDGHLQLPEHPPKF
jgi:hypothetical protein